MDNETMDNVSGSKNLPEWKVLSGWKHYPLKHYPLKHYPLNIILHANKNKE
jgi:hypothetical protein